MMGWKTLRLQLRFLLPLTAALVLAAVLAVPLLDQVTLRWFSRDLNSRGTLVATALSESVAGALAQAQTSRLRRLFEQTAQDERLLAIGLCSASGQWLERTDRLPSDLTCSRAMALAAETHPQLLLPSGSVHVSVHEVSGVAVTPPAPAAARTAPDADWAPGEQAPAAEPPARSVAEAEPPAPSVLGRLVLVHDLSFIDRRSRDSRNYLIGMFTALGLVIALITVVVAQISWRGWVKGVRALLRGEMLVTPFPQAAAAPELVPLEAELRSRLRDLEDEYRRFQGPEVDWDAQRLRGLLLTQLSGDQVIVVSNREPYIHDRVDGRVVVRRPASGLVTAVEPVMRACSGTWIAHGSGSADRDSVDAADRVPVPPQHEDYWLRRIWLTPEEEQGYYYGFANEGLWPLCHVAHVRPVFRESDWETYREVNRRFADAVVAESRSEDPVVLVQDYHFALLPALVRERLPQATILTFWHIPWPNPESFGICPWRREILQGMLGSTILGFHTRYHCKNFIETVDRYLEARIEHEHATIAHGGKETLVESYPISIAWPDAADAQVWPAPADCRRAVRDRLGLPPDALLAVGVDRFDYTKGILERLNAMERVLEKHPSLVGRFFMVQVAAPTRSALDEYRSFQQRVDDAVARINRRFTRDGRPAIHLLARHHEPDAVNELYRAADVCVVTSLHDGMNLVCKEFVAARDDMQGVLVLSRFAGAAREMPEALLVNPYHVEETADALYAAACMPSAEQRERMGALRSTVREFNVYRWAGRMLSDAGRLRLRSRIETRVRRSHAA